MSTHPSTPQPKKLIQFDWAIKTLLRNKKNFGVLEGFLSELLRTDVEILKIIGPLGEFADEDEVQGVSAHRPGVYMNILEEASTDTTEHFASSVELCKGSIESESNKRYPKDQSNRVDIAARLGNGEHVIIEVQSSHQDDFITRMLYGVSKVVVDYLQEGDHYNGIPRVISVNIVYFDLGEGEDYIYHGTTEFKGLHKNDILQLNKTEKKHYPDSIGKIFPEYYVLKIGAFDLRIRDTFDEWMYALKQSEVRPEFKAKGIQTAGNVLSRLSLSQEELAEYEIYIDNARNARSTIRTAFNDGKSEGLVEGKAEGLAEGKSVMILNLHNAQMPLQQIANIAEVSLEEVNKIVCRY